jgi:hypothetical protein
MPLFVISSRGVGLMTTRSPSGCSFEAVFEAKVFLLGRLRGVVVPVPGLVASASSGPRHRPGRTPAQSPVVVDLRAD